MVLRPTPIKLFAPESMQKRFHPYQFPAHGQNSQGSLLGNLSNVFLGVNPLRRPVHELKATHVPKNVQRELPQTPAQNWRFAMPMQGFKGEHIKVTVQHGHVRVEARRTEGKEENSKSYGMSRTITLPNTVDVTKLTSQLSDKGFLIIEVPYKTVNLISPLPARATSVVDQSSATQEKSKEFDEKQELGCTKNDEDELKCSSEEELEIGEISKLVENKDKLNATINSESLRETGAANDEVKKESSETQSEPLPKSPEFANVTQRQNVYHLSLNLGKYSPENIQISLEDTSLIIKAENKDDSGFLCKFARRYFLPGNLDLSALRCRRDSNGIMNITAPYRK